MPKPIIVVSGKQGQLGSELQQLAAVYPAYKFVFAGRDVLDLSDSSSIEQFFQQYKPVFFINCAAYTAVDKAEQDKNNAFKINASAVGNIATLCEQYQATLIHISTDYVFNGLGSKPYQPDDKTDPVNYYGETKLQGEQLALSNCSRTIIIRTSWVYSVYGHNFVKTMLRLMKERKEISVVNDQLGGPTYAKDLAVAILSIIDGLSQANPASSNLYGIYHFSNEGIISWFDFAVTIRDKSGLDCRVLPIPTTSFPTPAKRPSYSVMDTNKIISTFNIHPKNWTESLEECIGLLQAKDA